MIYNGISKIKFILINFYSWKTSIGFGSVQPSEFDQCGKNERIYKRI